MRTSKSGRKRSGSQREKATKQFESQDSTLIETAVPSVSTNEGVKAKDKRKSRKKSSRSKEAMVNTRTKKKQEGDRNRSKRG